MDQMQEAVRNSREELKKAEAGTKKPSSGVFNSRDHYLSFVNRYSEAGGATVKVKSWARYNAS
jgi:hypothetical protein